MLRYKIPIRLLAAFLCGWLVAFLNVFNYLFLYVQKTGYISIGTLVPILVLLVPLGVGVVAALTVDRENTHLISVAIYTGLLALTGWYVYWLPGVVRSDAELAASCHSSNPDPSCSHGPINPDSYFGTSFLFFSWFISLVLVLISALVTSLILSSIRKRRRVKQDPEKMANRRNMI